MIIRQATENDIDFIIDAIIEAEKSGSDLISYCAIFSLSEAEVRKMIRNILEEEIEGQELYLPNFLIADVDGIQAATLSAWVENESGMTSNIIKSNLFMYLLGRDVIINATDNINVMSGTAIARDSNALQIECVYTAPEYRGRGFTAQLIDAQIKLKAQAGATFNKIQIILLSNNENAIKAYAKAGFSIAQEKKSNNSAILELLPCDAKVLMEKEA